MKERRMVLPAGIYEEWLKYARVAQFGEPDAVRLAWDEFRSVAGSILDDAIVEGTACVDVEVDP